jgi:hypothetical protein
MATYTCHTECHHGGRLYRPGQTAEFSADSKIGKQPPRDKDGNVRHFFCDEKVPSAAAEAKAAAAPAAPEKDKKPPAK